MISSSPSRRRDQDVMALAMSGRHEVHIPDDGSCDVQVKLKGAVSLTETPYEEGIWCVNVSLPLGYPYQSPSIGFAPKTMLHSNVDLGSGSICLDVLNSMWTPQFSLLNVFDEFIPQLLRDPNPSDPLNGEVAALLLRDPEAHNTQVRAFVQKYAAKDFSFDDDDDEEDEEGGDDSGAKAMPIARSAAAPPPPPSAAAAASASSFACADEDEEEDEEDDDTGEQKMEEEPFPDDLSEVSELSDL